MSEIIETPYKKAKQEWDMRMGDSMHRVKIWQKCTFLLICICGVLSLGIIFYSSQPRRVPYVIEVQSDGEAVYKGNIGSTVYSLEEKHIRYYLAKFLEYTRTLSSDVVVVKKNWKSAYYFLTPAGANILNTYAQEMNPLSTHKTQRVDIKISSMLEHSKHTRQVNWRESVWNEHGELIAQNYWRGIFKFENRIPSTQEHLEKNPLGFFIDTFNWTEVRQ